MATTTTFRLLRELTGLSQAEASEFLGVRLDTVKSWDSGRRQAPETAARELIALAGKIERAADQALAQIEEATARQGSAPDVIELGLASDDHEAQSLGWPCVGAQRAMLARVVARGMATGYRFRVVPRGSTPATAGAADAHGR